MERLAKERQVDELKEKLQSSSLVILCDYRGLDVPSVTSLRQSFRKENCEYKVYKNTLVKIAVAGTPMEKIAPLLEGPTAVILSWDHPASAAKIAKDFAKEQKSFQIKGGFLDGGLLTGKQVEEVASMPSKEQILANLLGVLSSPASGLVGVLHAGLQNFVYLLDARKRESENQG